jgi:hypothetical protein
MGIRGRRPPPSPFLAQSLRSRDFRLVPVLGIAYLLRSIGGQPGADFVNLLPWFRLTKPQVGLFTTVALFPF